MLETKNREQEKRPILLPTRRTTIKTKQTYKKHGKNNIIFMVFTIHKRQTITRSIQTHTRKATQIRDKPESIPEPRKADKSTLFFMLFDLCF